MWFMKQNLGRKHYAKQLETLNNSFITKREENPKEAKNYRPVSLSSILCKIFELMVNKRPILYLKVKAKIFDWQFSFKKQKSTINLISKITYKVFDSNHLFWIKKGYARINFYKTLKQLECMKILYWLIDFLNALMSEKCFNVRIGSTTSQIRQTDLGVPQRWVLSVTLFVVAINDILSKLGNRSGWLTLRW